MSYFGASDISLSMLGGSAGGKVSSLAGSPTSTKNCSKPAEVLLAHPVASIPELDAPQGSEEVAQEPPESGGWVEEISPEQADGSIQRATRPLGASHGLYAALGVVVTQVNGQSPSAPLDCSSLLSVSSREASSVGPGVLCCWYSSSGCWYSSSGCWSSSE